MRKVVPPRDERIEEMGKPQPPKMGGISPKTVEVPPVDDLVKSLKEATVLAAFNRFLEEEQKPPCCIDCKCPPCLRGDCGGCLVNRARDTKAVKDYATMYRGTIYDK